VFVIDVALSDLDKAFISLLYPCPDSLRAEYLQGMVNELHAIEGPDLLDKIDVPSTWSMADAFRIANVGEPFSDRIIAALELHDMGLARSIFVDFLRNERKVDLNPWGSTRSRRR
jgi:hypothetical protein